MALIRKWLIPAVIFATTFLLYGNTIRNGYSLDDTYVAQNNSRVMKGLAGIPEILSSRYVDEEGNSFGYRPVAVITFAIEHELWGQNPHLSHLINTLLYALCSVLLYLLIRKIFHNTSRIFALTVVLLFAAHPIHTEVVASLKNRETLLSFLFSLVSLRLFLKWYDTRKVWLVAAGILAFAMAFLSKQDAVTFAAVIPLALYYYSSQQIKTEIIFQKIKNLFSRPYIYLSLAGMAALLYYFSMHGLGGVVAALSYFSSLIFLIIHYRKQKEWTKHVNEQRRKISYLFLAAGILFFLAAVYFMNSFLPLLSLLSFFVFFLRIPEKNTMRLIHIPSQWLYLLIPIMVLGLAAVIFYKLPNLYLPAEEKIVYHFENPQFVQAAGYPKWPLAFYTLFFYLQKLIWPHPLGFYYGYKMIPEADWLTPEVLLSAVFHLALLVIALWKLPAKHILSFAILYYLATISIFTNVVIQIPGIVGERMAFFPSLGFCMIVAWGIFKLLRIPVNSMVISRRNVLQVSLVLLLFMVPYSVKTINRNTQWKDYLALYSHDIAYLENSAKANNMYANQLLKEAFNNEVKNPETEIQQQYLHLAFKHIQKALEIDSTFKFAWNNLGYITVVYKDKKEEALNYLKKAVSIDPDYADAHFNMGSIYKQLHDYNLAEVHLKKASGLKPENFKYLVELGDNYILQGKPDDAISVSRKAAILHPRSELSFVIIGNAYWIKKDTLNTIKHWERAFELNPNDLNLCMNLAGYYQSTGSEKARFYKTKAIELQEKRSEK